MAMDQNSGRLRIDSKLISFWRLVPERKLPRHARLVFVAGVARILAVGLSQ
jgi:hypothetical protein